MAPAKLPPIHILLTPLGATVDIILAPLDKWKPEIIFAFTSMINSIEIVKDNLRYAWNINCGPNGPPEVRTVVIDQPWQANTIEDVMAAVDSVMEKAEHEFPHRTIEWHISLTGGTNLMAVGMALSAQTHLIPVYYTVPGDKYPELRSTPSKLVIDIPLFEQLGPAVSLLGKSNTKVKLFEVLKDADEPLTAERMAKETDTSKAAVYAQLAPLVEKGLVVKEEGSTYRSTTTGILAYHRVKGHSTS